LDVRIVRRVLSLRRIAEDRPRKPIRRVEVAFGEAGEGRGPIIGTFIRDGAAIRHGYLE
jgi:hypothetical protein